MTKETIGFIGGGNMARCIIGGLIESGWPRGAIMASDPSSTARNALHETWAVTCVSDNAAVVSGSQVVVLAVKPQALREVLQPLAGVLASRKPLLVSIVAGVRLAAICHWAGTELPVVRAMPNMPALVGSGASGLCANDLVSEPQREIAESILRAVGVTIWVEDESLVDTITAVSGSGPAYFFYLMESIEQAALANGLDADTARLLTLETAFGAAKLALESSESPASLRQRVTSPGGTTEAAINTMADGKLPQVVGAGVEAALRRSRELAELFTGD
ncbi:MAG: pyrroline-5-carboxylate reductase [Pseudomonadota bacterium]|nr:pyrroline-5-carboxylate reductase [Pseudomonadota bacterium]